VAGQGTTSQSHTYQFTDANLARYAAEVLYYRLRQVDTDGTSTYSPVRTVQVGALALTFEAFPTSLPTGQELSLRIRTPSAGPASLLVTDAVGHAVLQQQVTLPAGVATVSLPQARQWGAGLYTLRVQQGNWQQASKVVRE
jgi:hypothetical protein